MPLFKWFKRPQPPTSLRSGGTAVIRTPRPPQFPLLPRRPKAEGFQSLTPHGGSLYGGFIDPPTPSPERQHPFLRALRDLIPDISAGVWAWVRLCSTKRTIAFSGGSAIDRERARILLEDLEARILESSFDHRPGFDGIVEQFLLSVFTVGAYAGEATAEPDRRGIARFFPIDPATVRFRRFPSSGRITPHQLQAGGEMTPLKEESFFYFGLDADPASPYGRSPLMSLPFVVRLQQQLFEDMGKSAHNAGYPTLHVKYSAPEREPGESVADYQNRVQQDFETISSAMQTRSPESNFLTQDNVSIQYIGPNGQMLRWKETLETLSEQTAAGLHVAPMLIGRNYGTTQSWARAQYDLMVNNAASVQRAAARLVDWLANLELAFHNSPVRTACSFAPHSAWNDVDEARAQSIRLGTLLKLRDEGLIDDRQLMCKLEECR